MNFGSTKEIRNLDENESRGSVRHIFRKGEIAKTIKQFEIRIKVSNPKQEMQEFIKLSDDLRQMREEGRLANAHKDPSLRPCFWFEFPKEDVDGSYFIVRSWTEEVK